MESKVMCLRRENWDDVSQTWKVIFVSHKRKVVGCVSWMKSRVMCPIHKKVGGVSHTWKWNIKQKISNIKIKSMFIMILRQRFNVPLWIGHTFGLNVMSIPIPCTIPLFSVLLLPKWSERTKWIWQI